MLSFNNNYYKTTLQLVVGLVLVFLLGACARSALLLVNSLARLGDYTLYHDIAYGADPMQKLDIYVPSAVTNKPELQQPVVVFFYGGCWGACSTLSKESYLFVAETLSSHGYIVVVADYRLYPAVKFPLIIQDAASAVKWLRDNISAYGGQSEQLYLLGHSAGAHLAVMLNLNEDYLLDARKSIKGTIGLAGPYDFLPFTEAYQPDLFGPQSQYAASQPINFVDGTEPPLLLLHGKQDVRVKIKNATNLTAKVLAAQGDVQTIFYDDIDHTGILSAFARPFRKKRPVVGDIVEFIESQH